MKFFRKWSLLLILLVFTCSLFITSCGVSNENIGNLNEQSNISTNTTSQESSEAPTREIAPDGSYENDKEAPNTDDYQIVFKDKYGDRFYLNHKYTRYGYKRYRGLWYCYSNKTQYLTDVTYSTSSNSLALTAYYKNKFVFNYHLTKKSDTFFEGTYGYLWNTYNIYSHYYMKINIEKGSF